MKNLIFLFVLIFITFSLITSCGSEDDDAESGTPEEELYRQFAELSAAKANGEIDDETFEAKKEEIWEQLGIELQ